MKVYVCLTNYMGGQQDVAVFSSESKAHRFLEAEDLSGSPAVQALEVIGLPEEEGLVFTASSYDRSHDIHHFMGVYGSYEEAKKHSGDKGQVLRRRIDERGG